MLGGVLFFSGWKGKERKGRQEKAREFHLFCSDVILLQSYCRLEKVKWQPAHCPQELKLLEGRGMASAVTHLKAHENE
jgi:hypothetical protein